MQEPVNQQSECMLVKLQGETEEQCLMRQQGMQAEAMRGNQGGMSPSMMMRPESAAPAAGGTGVEGLEYAVAGDGGAALPAGEAGMMSYAAPVAAMAGFMKMAHDQGLIDKNTEVMEDAYQGIKDPARKIYDAGSNVMSKLKPWEWF